MLYAIQCTVYTIFTIHYAIQCTLYTIPTLYTIQYTIYIIQFIPQYIHYTAQYIQYTLCVLCSYTKYANIQVQTCVMCIVYILYNAYSGVPKVSTFLSKFYILVYLSIYDISRLAHSQRPFQMFTVNPLIQCIYIDLKANLRGFDLANYEAAVLPLDKKRSNMIFRRRKPTFMMQFVSIVIIN